MSSQKGEILTQIRTGIMPCEDEGRVEGDASAWQGIPNIARKASEAQRVFIELILLTALKRNQPQ